MSNMYTPAKKKADTGYLWFWVMIATLLLLSILLYCVSGGDITIFKQGHPLPFVV